MPNGNGDGGGNGGDSFVEALVELLPQPLREALSKPFHILPGTSPEEIFRTLLTLGVEKHLPVRLAEIGAALPQLIALAGGGPRAILQSVGGQVGQAGTQLHSILANRSRTLGPFGGGQLTRANALAGAGLQGQLANLFSGAQTEGQNLLNRMLEGVSLIGGTPRSREQITRLPFQLGITPEGLQGLMTLGQRLFGKPR